MTRLLYVIIILITCATDSVAQVYRIRETFLAKGYQEYHGTEMKLLPSGREKFDCLVRDISTAKHYVHAEYYKWWNDSIGCAVLDALAESARRGVKVRILYDAFGNDGKKPQVTKEFLEHYRSLGVEIVPFDPMRFPYVNHALHRLHRKMVVIDGRVVYTGGMNIAQYYIYGRPEIGRWRDMHARLQGPVADAYEKLFAGMWKKVKGEDLDSVEYAYDSNSPLAGETPVQTGCAAFVIDRKPGRESKAIRESYVACLDNAQSYVRMINPYIMPSTSIMKALKRALRRGVRVEIMCSLRGDGVMSEASTARELHHLQKMGAVVWLCRDGFHHDKIVIVDDELCSVGTANLDARSLAFDYEVNAWLFSPEYCTQLNRYFEQEKRMSVRLTRENYTRLYTGKTRRLGWWIKGLRVIL